MATCFLNLRLTLWLFLVRAQNTEVLVVEHVELVVKHVEYAAGNLVEDA